MSSSNKREPENSIRIERVILTIYIFYTICILLSMPQYQELRVLLPLLAGLLFSVWMHVRQVRTYTFRTYVTTAVMWLNLFFYALYTDDFPGMLTSVATVVSLQALYFLPEIFRIGDVFYTAMIAAHLFFLRDLQLSFHGNGVRMLLRLLSVYLISGIARYFVKLQQESNQRLITNIESLRRAESSKDDFLANVSHEIRTPVNTICGMSDILLQGELPEEARENVYGIQMAGRNLYSLVSDILDFSELQSGNITVVREAYSITSVVNDLIHIAAARNGEKRLELIVDCDPNIPKTLVGDRQKICRAVMNILDNAIKFTEAGGVLLTVASRKEAYGVNLCFMVQDTGIGILPENLEKIFTSFNQVDTRRSRTDGGIGLGLAISQALAEKMGGFLNIQSVYGEGTEVSIALPQGVEEEEPCISVKNPERIRCLVYLQPDRYKYPLLREGFHTSMSHMAQKFGISFHFCRNLTEVKRRWKEEPVTHLFVSDREYEEDSAWFEEAAKRAEVIRISGANPAEIRRDSRLHCIHEPFYALTIASILNGKDPFGGIAGVAQTLFTAPSVRVLVVDDNRMNLKVVEGLLRPYQLKVSVAMSGLEALKMLESKAFDFVFMDHMMPEMDGVETFHRIREKPDAYFQTVPVIALTANAVGDAREMFLSEGFADYISKPIELSALDHVLRKFIPEERRQTLEDEQPAAADSEKGDSSKTKGIPCSRGTEQEQGGLRRIDVQKGLGYTGGSYEDYLEILKFYQSSGEKQIRSLRQACLEKDWKQYIILTHTIKSTSASIGADALARLAADLEASGRKEDFEKIEERTEAMLSEYEQVLEEISKQHLLQSSGEEKEPPLLQKEKEFTGLEFSACCKRLNEKLNSFDSEAVEAYLDRVGKACYHGRLVEDLLQPVREKAREFDFLGAEEALLEIQERERGG